VVAAHGNGAVRHELHDGVQHPARVGAVADVVAQEGIALGALCLRMVQYRLHRLAVGVQVGDQCQFHLGSCLLPSGCQRALTAG
jgi:hypothetical protein